MRRYKIEKLLTNLDSKYALVIASAKRARQINDYLNSVKKQELPTVVAPQVPLEVAIKSEPLAIALEEIENGQIAFETTYKGIK